jgi:hypothetical protein
MAKPKSGSKNPAAKGRPAAPSLLKGWNAIAAFLGQPISVAQRWGKAGMPIERQGRSVTADPAKLNQWLGKEAAGPVHVAAESPDLSAELKQGLSFVRKSHPK